MNANLLKIFTDAVERLPLARMLLLAAVFLLATFIFNADKIALLLQAWQ